MCEPTTIAALSLAATVASTAIGVVGQMQQGAAAKDAAKYQEQVAKNNSIMAQRAAEDAKRRGEFQASQERLRMRLLLGSQRATFASRGVDLASGTVADVAAGTAQAGELDAQTALENSRREQQGFLVEANNYTAQGQLARFEGQNAQRASTIAAGGTILGGAGAVADKWYNYRQQGVF